MTQYTITVAELINLLRAVNDKSLTVCCDLNDPNNAVVDVFKGVKMTQYTITVAELINLLRAG